MQTQFTIRPRPDGSFAIDLEGAEYTLANINIAPESGGQAAIRLLAQTHVGTLVELRGYIDLIGTISGMLEDADPLIHPIVIQIHDIEIVPAVLDIQK